MTHDEALNALCNSDIYDTEEALSLTDWAEGILKVLGWRQMQYELEWFRILMTRFHPTTAATLKMGEPTHGRVFVDEIR